MENLYSIFKTKRCNKSKKPGSRKQCQTKFQEGHFILELLILVLFFSFILQSTYLMKSRFSKAKTKRYTNFNQQWRKLEKYYEK